MDGQLRIQLSEDGADAARLDALTGYLRQDLAQLDVDDVTALPAGPPPPGARAVDATAVGGLLVALSGSADGLRSLVRAVQAWLGRGSGVGRTIRLEIGGDALELSAGQRGRPGAAHRAVRQPPQRIARRSFGRPAAAR